MDSMTHPTDTAKSEELKAIAHIMDRNVPNAHADGCPGCIDWARRMNEYAAKNPEEFKPIDLIARLNFLRSLPNSQRSNDAIDDAMEEAAEQLADLRARLASVANSVSSPPQNDAGVGVREACAKIADDFADAIATQKSHPDPLPIDTNEGWRRVEDAARDIADAIRRTPMSELQALGQEFEAGEWHNAVERLGEALFAMSDSLRRSHWIERPENHAIYEKVVAAFQALPSAPSGEGSDHG
ncbi:hypothetical protein [Sphingobium sp. YC-XJ3]|uniref:hypothetical protein n=1 Tax=Sphingobium sp. YC-XJ3 TaxID=3024245 RepID=UPI00235F9D58|nr:hypothetical protein [Sphingobium sp. YC-XJ3]WDA36447.1 hypothetical protein PO876_23960 [Sphingobium sp. YC-XJ3]